MSLLTALLALALLMFVAYRGFSVILFAPVCALLAVLFTDPSLVLPIFSGVFMERMVGFIKSYLPVFLLGAVFGKVIELSGFARSIVTAVIGLVGRDRAMLSIVLVCALLTYGGVSLFVVVFAVYPFAAEMFRQGGIPKRLIPATIALGAFTFTMDVLPGTPQIQNIIPTTFFKTDTWAAPWLGVIGALFVLVTGLAYLEWRRRRAARAGEGYGSKLVNEPEAFTEQKLPNPWLAVLPLVIVGVMNKVLTLLIPRFYGGAHSAALPGLAKPVVTHVSSVAAIWAKAYSDAVFVAARSAPAIAALLPSAKRSLIGLKAMASGGMDTLPDNGAVITLLAVTGLTHKESYRDIFGITLIKTAAVAVAIVVFYLTGIY